MPAPLELALASLLPTVSFLPPDLISLASSLLAQSRSKAASLKPDEEIARIYACAHIACQRLQRRLDLEVGKPNPPCRAGVYKRLWGYLDGVLTGDGGRRGGGVVGGSVTTPTRSRGRDAIGGVGGSGKAKGTTRTERKTGEEVVKTPATGSKRTRDTTATATARSADDAVPDFAMPLIRAICKACNTSSAVPHILVGASSVVAEIVSRANRRATDTEPSAKRRRRTPQSSTRAIAAQSPTPAATGGVATSKWPALLIALQIYTAAKLKGFEPESEKVRDVREKSIDAVKAFCEDGRRSIPEGLDTQLESLDSNIGFYMLEAEDGGWLEMEWYHNIPTSEATGEDHDTVVADSEDEDYDDLMTPRKRPYKTPLRRKEKQGGKAALGVEEDLGAAGLLPGLGTMFQPAVDWLSEGRREEFAGWKKAIMKEIREVEQAACC